MLTVDFVDHDDIVASSKEGLRKMRAAERERPCDPISEERGDFGHCTRLLT